MRDAQIAVATPFIANRTTDLATSARAAAMRISAARWLVDFPPLYTATFALVIGDALGNAGVYVPLTFALVIALLATGHI